MAYIDKEKVEKEKTMIVALLQEFIDEYKLYSESSIDYHYGRADGVETARNVVVRRLDTLLKESHVDAEKVNHGEWIKRVIKIPCAWDEGGYETQINYVCSECGFINDLGKTNGCPECLAKMDKCKENDNEN